MTCGCAFKSQTKKKVRIPLKKGVFSKHGYKDIKSIPLKKRNKVLDKLVKELGPLDVFRRLNALYIINRSKPAGKVLKRDRNYVKNNYFGAVMRKRVTRKNNKPTIRVKRQRKKC